jgi:hypothetical protein
MELVVERGSPRGMEQEIPRLGLVVRDAVIRDGQLVGADKHHGLGLD